MPAPRTTVLLLTGALALAACGGDDPPPAPPAVTAPTTTSAPPPTRTPTAAPTTLPPVTISPSPTATPTTAPAPTGPAVLTGDGVEVGDAVIGFGTSYDQAVTALAGLGEPTLDTGSSDPFSAYGTCPGTVLRALEYEGGALVLLFGDPETRDGSFTLYAWNLRDESEAVARALVGDVTTVEFGVGTVLEQLQADLGVALTVFEGDEVFPPGFDVADQSGGLSGFVDELRPQGQVTFVSAGTACGE